MSHALLALSPPSSCLVLSLDFKLVKLVVLSFGEPSSLAFRRNKMGSFSVFLGSKPRGERNTDSLINNTASFESGRWRQPSRSYYHAQRDSSLMCYIALKQRIAIPRARVFNGLIAEICSKTTYRRPASSVPCQRPRHLFLPQDDVSPSGEHGSILNTELCSETTYRRPGSSVMYHARISRESLRHQNLAQDDISSSGEQVLTPDFPRLKPCGATADLLVAFVSKSILGAASLWLF
ncbi:uncharacterized protein ARMOST_02698 [Armillaria ostoyae]|uniref:Uncharacterized protein n=1 Tax=Armillaria ostoyae TaxID=47428 RepID=A0A284QSE8_ARMOS|nr:uncharacterized protein ARMOST_02696 [Armillaria ostoyae]SJK99400.1 uncharacterized protein ARMOST_02698 [Armillaria ostoyae]